MYDDLLPLKTPEQLLGNLKPVDSAELRRKHADLPDDYVSFLSRIGAGTIGRSQYSLYTGPRRARLRLRRRATSTRGRASFWR